MSTLTKRFLFLFVGTILLVGCQLSPVTPIPIPAGTRTVSTPIPAASTNKVMATDTSLAAASPTSALTITPDLRIWGAQTQAAWTATFQAFTAKAYAHETQIMANNATSDAQYWITQTAVVKTLLTTVTPKVYRSYHSPDGKWLAQIIQFPCTKVRTEPESWPDAYEILRINDQEVGSVYYFCGGQGAYGFEGKFWTPDNRFFYYTDAREGWPDGGYPWRRPISRFDTATGKRETLHIAEFSPDRQRIAGGQGTDLVVWEVYGETVRHFSGLPAGQKPFGVIWSAWSPDKRRLAYLTQTYCQDTYPCPTTLHLIDTQTWQQTQLLDQSAAPMLTVEWKGPNTLGLWGADFQSTWLFDLKTNTLTKVVPTLALTPRPSRTPNP